MIFKCCFKIFTWKEFTQVADCVPTIIFLGLFLTEPYLGHTGWVWVWSTTSGLQRKPIYPQASDLETTKTRKTWIRWAYFSIFSLTKCSKAKQSSFKVVFCYLPVKAANTLKNNKNKKIKKLSHLARVAVKDFFHASGSICWTFWSKQP